MTSTELVLFVLKIEGIALAVALATIFIYASWSRAARASRERRLAAARAIIATHLESKRVPDHLMPPLRALPLDDQRRLFSAIAPSVGEKEREWLRGIATQLGVFQSATADTQSSQWWTRLGAARLLTLLDADPQVMHALLRDPEAVVRAQIANYIAQHPTPAGIDALVEMLGDPEALCRYAAKDALMRLGSAAVPKIVDRLRDPSDPQAVPLLEVACATATHAYLPAAVAHLNDPRAEARLRVARLLRGIGGQGAADHLMGLASDADPRVREAAVEALGYLNHWVASAPVARLLDDPVSRVRLSAALALDQLGPTGELLLRRARAKGSDRAAAAASRILDDPSRIVSSPPPTA